jgi:hypothetical protein
VNVISVLVYRKSNYKTQSACTYLNCKRVLDFYLNFLKNIDMKISGTMFVNEP